MKTENILPELWETVEKNKNYSGKYMRLFNWLNKDNLSAIVKDKNIFWFELNSNSQIPNYIYNILKQWGYNKGLIYLYDLPERPI